MVGAVVVDFDGVYDPNLVNDRLLLGLKGTMSEFELNLLRQRSREAILQKAHRGELQFLLPVGFCWNASGQTEKDPDQHVQQAIQLIFDKLVELGSVRQTLLWFRQHNVSIPVLPRDPGEPPIVWKLPVYRQIWAIVTNPVYAGAYVFGRREVRIKMVDGRARKSKGHLKPQSTWTVLIPNHHPGYVMWEQYERNQAMLAANTHMKSDGNAKAGRGGRALLSGILRCRRCGRMLHVSYTGKEHIAPRYDCNDAHLHHGEARCLSFGGLWVDEAVANEVLRAIEGNAIEAAVGAAQQIEEQRQQLRRSLELEAEQARYEARLAARRYEAVDPEQRLVAAELEARWNSALQKKQELENRLADFDRQTNQTSVPSKELLLSLAQDLPAIWNSPSTDMRLKQRIVRILIEEVVADVDASSREIVLLIHWAGGRHSELRVKKREAGQHGKCTNLEAIEVVRHMAGRFPDELIAATLNRLGLRTGVGNTWNKLRVCSLRNYQQLPAFNRDQPQSRLTLEEAARRLQVSAASIRRLIAEEKLPASQVVECAPWEIPAEALESESVRDAISNIKNRTTRPRTHIVDGQQTMFSED